MMNAMVERHCKKCLGCQAKRKHEFTVYATVLNSFFLFISLKALTTITSLKSHSSTKRIHASFPYGCSFLNLTYVFRQLNNLIRECLEAMRGTSSSC